MFCVVTSYTQLGQDGVARVEHLHFSFHIGKAYFMLVLV